ncbi:MAG: hypothetical protein ACTTHG_00960 [Treponemataceae bacterium]
MKYKFSFYLSIFLALLSIVFLFVFKVNTNSSPWKKWRTLAVPLQYDEKQVLNELEKIGIKNVISLKSQRTNTATQMVPVLPKEFQLYDTNLDNYFYDKTKQYNIYYIQKPFLKSKLKKLSFMKESKLDLNSEIFNFPIYIVLLCYILMIVFIKERIKYAISAIPLPVLVFSNPSFASLICALFSFCSIFFIEKTDMRKHQFAAVIKNHFIILGFICSTICSLASGFGFFLLYLTSLIGCVSLFSVFTIIQKQLKKSCQYFNYVKINTANFLPALKKTSVTVFYLLALLILLTGLLFFLLPVNFSNKFENEFSIPAPVKKFGKYNLSSYKKLESKKIHSDLPDLADYINQTWNSQIFPYITLNQNKVFFTKIKNNTSISYTDYVEVLNENTNRTSIVPVEVEVLKFNNKYVKNNIKNISKTFTIEKILFDQNGFYEVNYLKSKNNIFSLIFCMIAGLFFSITDILLFFVGKK